MNHENGDGSTSGCLTEAETERTDRSCFFRRLSACASVQLTWQTSKCEPVLTEAHVDEPSLSLSLLPMLL